MPSVGVILWNVIFGVIGFAFFVYGKKQVAFVPLICGLILMIFPFFISNVYLLVGIGAVLILLPFLIK